VAGCRECGRPLSTGAEKKRGRCEDCPASYDEELFDRLREWRKERAGEESVPAFVVFTDATLQLIAEQKPRTPEALLRISGIGRSKLERYGDDVLTLVS
jgi:DNA helicase-2/ATP-dependent DNA helicase PcrA